MSPRLSPVAVSDAKQDYLLWSLFLVDAIRESWCCVFLNFANRYGAGLGSFLRVLLLDFEGINSVLTSFNVSPRLSKSPRRYPATLLQNSDRPYLINTRIE